MEKKKAGRQYLKIDDKISYRTKIEIESEIDNDKNEAIKQKKEKYKRRFKGIVFETVFTRNYVQSEAFQETLGFVNKAYLTSPSCSIGLLVSFPFGFIVLSAAW